VEVGQIGTEEREIVRNWDMPRARARIGAIKLKNAAMAALSELENFSLDEAAPLTRRHGYLPVAK
jgi:hypothetical protein